MMERMRDSWASRTIHGQGLITRAHFPPTTEAFAPVFEKTGHLMTVPGWTLEEVHMWTTVGEGVSTGHSGVSLLMSPGDQMNRFW